MPCVKREIIRITIFRGNQKDEPTIQGAQVFWQNAEMASLLLSAWVCHRDTARDQNYRRYIHGQKTSRRLVTEQAMSADS